jgi:hypothetical protein
VRGGLTAGLVAYTPEQWIAASTLALAIATVALVLVTLALGYAAWRTYQTSRDAFRATATDLTRQFELSVAASRLAAEASARSIRQTTLENLSRWANETWMAFEECDRVAREQQHCDLETALEQPSYPLVLAIAPLLRRTEHLAQGVKSGVFDLETVQALDGSRLRQIWATFEPYITVLRTRSTFGRSPNPRAYEMFEWLIQQLSSTDRP